MMIRGGGGGGDMGEWGVIDIHDMFEFHPMCRNSFRGVEVWTMDPMVH